MAHSRSGRLRPFATLIVAGLFAGFADLTVIQAADIDASATLAGDEPTEIDADAAEILREIREHGER